MEAKTDRDALQAKVDRLEAAVRRLEATEADVQTASFAATAADVQGLMREQARIWNLSANDGSAMPFKEVPFVDGSWPSKPVPAAVPDGVRGRDALPVIRSLLDLENMGGEVLSMFHPKIAYFGRSVRTKFGLKRPKIGWNPRILTDPSAQMDGGSEGIHPLRAWLAMLSALGFSGCEPNTSAKWMEPPSPKDRDVRAFGWDIAQNFALFVRTRMPHEADILAISVRIRMEHGSGFAWVLTEPGIGHFLSESQL
ncbi:hypothetical protein EVG20_g1253 [Dentipellis fragilis]|uniref:Mug135-like C-terminal domain-containing protein n=1 Tax=Dentipellis fragilis TaxID=205917 RepID=A0A4Y9ZB23_9AGAM|nr:hypothetical protein EVG20_g1253 [Dentipellis fragilis]